MFFIFRQNDKFLNLTMFSDIFHTLCDIIEMINTIFSPILIPTMLAMLVIDIFGAYGIAQNIFLNEKSSEMLILTNSFYFIMHFFLKVSIAHIGCTTSHAAEMIKITVAKKTNELPPKEIFRSFYHQMLLQFQARNVKLQNSFFIVDWNIILAVSKSWKKTKNL